MACLLYGLHSYGPSSTETHDGVPPTRFNTDARVRVALLSITAANVGLDFTGASSVVFAELPTEVADLRQANITSYGL